MLAAAKTSTIGQHSNVYLGSLVATVNKNTLRNTAYSTSSPANCIALLFLR